MKIFKRMLSVCLSVAMIATMLTVTPVFAAENVCRIDDTYYTSLEDAVSNVTSGGTITLIADVTISSRLSVTKSFTITDDGTQRTITIANSDTSSTGGYGRGIQIGSSATLTIKGTSAGNIVLDGTGNAGVGIMVYKGSLNLENATVQGFTNSMSGASTSYGGAISVGYKGNSSTYTTSANIKNVTFQNNSSSYGSDAYVHTGGSISLDGTVTMNSLYLADGIYATPASTLDSSSYIGIYLATYTAGTTVLDGSYVADKYSLFKLPGTSDYSIGSDGALKEKAVAKWSGNTYKSLEAAITAAASSSTTPRTITLIDDAEVSSNISFSKSSFVIQDDGNPHTIYVYNSDNSSSSSYGRGFSMAFSKESYYVTFKATSKGNLTIVGHNPDESLYNAGVLFAVRGGTLNLTNVIIKDCINSVNSSTGTTRFGGAICAMLSDDDSRGNVTLNNCEISNCQSAYGAAIYSYGGTVNLTSTSIHDCATTGTTGAVSINDEPGEIETELSHEGILNLYSGVKIYDNYKYTNLDNIDKGTPSNVSIENYKQIALQASTSTSSIGIDFGNEGDDFCLTSSVTPTQGTIYRDGNSSFKPKRNTSTGTVYWKTYTYDVNWGDYTTISSTSIGATTYKYASATVTADSSGVATSVVVDNGTFSLDWSALSALTNVTSYEALLADGTHVSGDKPTSGTVSYKGLTLYGTKITAANSATFIKSLVFTNTGSNIAQNISFGMAEALNDGEKYFGGSKYTYVTDSLTWDKANNVASDAGGNLVFIDNKTENEFVNDITGTNIWSGAEQKLNAWYWSDGTKFAANATTNEGYNGAYVNWAADEPNGEDEYMIMNSDGYWECEDCNTAYNYVIEKTDSHKVVNSVSIAASVTTSLLSSMNLSFDGDISMYYYFLFADDIKTETSDKVVVVVGSGDDKVTVSSTIAEMSTLTDSQGNYGIKVAVPAKMMGASVSIALCKADGTVIRTYANYGGLHPEKNYNCLYYANYMYAQQDDRYNSYYSEDLISMITAMLNYGAAAQQQFGYDTENLVNAGHEDEAAVMTSLPSEDIVEYTGTNFSSAKLVAGSETIMNLTYTGSGTTATVAFDGVQTTNFTFSGGTLSIPVSAQNLGKTCEITIGSDYAILNANYLINEILTSASSTSAKKLTCDRLYKFGKAADQYFGVYQQNTNMIEAVLETAYAYLAKGLDTQYDQDSLDSVAISSEHDYPQGRRQLFANPEEATDYNDIYLDCSSFCFNVYANVFGAENTLNAFINSNYAKYSNFRTAYLNYENNSKSVVDSHTFDVPDEWYNQTDLSSYIAEWTAYIEYAKTIMQPGDMLTYYGYNTSGNLGGHIVMWTGSGFIHCTGSDYDYDTGTDKIETTGAVNYLTPAQFNYTYLMRHGAQKAVILRPLNVLGSDEILDSAVARTQLGSISVEATAVDTTNSVDLYQGQYVNNGDTVTYTITVANKAMTGNLSVSKEINVVYTPSSSLVNVSSEDGGTYADGKVVWSDVSLGAGETITLTFTGTVSGTVGDILDGGSGEISLSDAGSAAKSISFEAFDAEIESALPSDFATKLTYVASNASSFVSTDGAATVNAMLQYITGDSTRSIGSDNDAVMDSLRSVTSLGNYYPSLSNYWEGNIVSNFCGGRKLYMPSIDNGPCSYVNRVRNITIDNLKVGDIIMTYRDSTSLTDYYIYLGNDQMLNISNTLSTSTVTASDICEKINGRSLWGIFRLTK